MIFDQTSTRRAPTGRHRAVRGWLLILAWSAALLGVTPAWGAEDPGFAALGEGFTARSEGEAMRVAHRMFTAGDWDCDGVAAIDRLSAPITEIDVTAGDGIDLAALAVVALNEEGTVLEPVPVIVEAQETSPPVWDDSDFEEHEGPLVLVHEGSFSIRVRPYCTGPGPELLIEVTVAPPPEEE